MYDNWYVWRTDPKTGIQTYGGEFTDAKTALDWKKAQDDAEKITINNVGPSAVVREFRANPKAVMADPEKKAAYEAVAKHRDWKHPAAAAGTRAERAKFSPVKVTHKSAPVVVKHARKKNADELKLEAAAQQELAQHRQDEAAELAAEAEAMQDN